MREGNHIVDGVKDWEPGGPDQIEPGTILKEDKGTTITNFLILKL